MLYGLESLKLAFTQTWLKRGDVAVAAGSDSDNDSDGDGDTELGNGSDDDI